MSALPWVKWFPAAWLSDPALSRCSPATRGVWIDALNAMMLTDAYALRGTLAELAQICRCSVEDFRSAVRELQAYDAARITWEADGRRVEIVSRRLLRQAEISALRRQAAQARHIKHPARGRAWSLEECWNAAAGIGLTREMVAAFHAHYAARQWRDQNDRPIANLAHALAVWKQNTLSHQNEPPGGQQRMLSDTELEAIRRKARMKRLPDGTWG